jgi:Holliday junction resolvasome RuvABC DNA-binding subunit
MKGINKTAKRIIIDLKDKVTKMGDIPTSSFPSISNHSVRDEAGSALLALGFQKMLSIKCSIHYQR